MAARCVGRVSQVKIAYGKEEDEDRWEEYGSHKWGGGDQMRHLWQYVRKGRC